MFERFSKSAREVVERAQADAEALGRERIDADVLLLGVAGGESRAAAVLAEHGATHRALRERAASGGLDGKALAAIGIDLDEIRRRAEESFGPGALERGRRARGGYVPFTPGAKKALELSLREAIAGGEREIGPEHLVLGVLREGGAEALLRSVGADPAVLRDELSPAGSRRARGA